MPRNIPACTTSGVRRFKVDYASFLSQHDIVFQNPVEPYAQKAGENFIDGPLMGNGDVGLVVHGTPEKILINVGKNDVWDRRDNNKATRPWITQAEVTEYVNRGEAKTITDLARSLYQMGSPNNGPPLPKPVGQIIIRNGVLAGAEFHQRLSLYEAIVNSDFSADGAEAQVSSFVSADENLIAIRYACESEEDVELVLELYRWNDGADKTIAAPAVGCDQECIWVRHRLPPDALYPEGFEYVMCAVVKGATWVTEKAPNISRLRIRGAKKLQIEMFVAVATSRDADDPFAQSVRIAQAAAAKGYDDLHEKHKAWWAGFWGKSFIDLSDGFMTNLWYLNQYFLACCSKQGKTAPGLYGSWITNDSSWWRGDYHLDYNFQQQYWGVYSSNHVELAYPYYDVIETLIPAAKQEAQQIYQCKGTKYPVVAFPVKGGARRYQPFPWDRIMAISAWVVQNFWWHYKYTMDKDFLAKRAYPVIRESVRFYEDYLRKEDGKYVIWPTVSPEHHGLTDYFEFNRNCTIDLALIRFLFKAILEASEVLGVDQDDRAQWVDILDNLADYPTCETDAGEIVVDVDNAQPIVYNFPVPAAPVFPAEQIGIDSPAETYELAKRTAETIETNGNDSYIALPICWMRLGLKDKYQAFRQRTAANVRSNGCIAMNGSEQAWLWWNAGPVVENFAFTAVINEMLLQSYNGKIRVFPALPDGMSAKIADLRAVGAFLVSSEIDDGQVKYIAVKSEQGSACTVVNPWQDHDAIRVTDITGDNELQVSPMNQEVTFATEKGHDYIIDRPDVPFESFAVTVLQGVRREKPRVRRTTSRIDYYGEQP